MSQTAVIILVIILILLGTIVLTYNRLIAMIESVRNNQKQIDIQLDRRFKVFESLINVVKKYMDYEKSTLKEVIALRSQAQTAHEQGDEKTRIDAENKISQIAGGIKLIFEQYPQLKANQNAMQLQEEIVNTENKLAYSKQALNDRIEQYNARKKSFFTSLIVALFRNKLDFNYEYWQLGEKAVAEKEAYTVKL
jgi:LemA protein